MKIAHLLAVGVCALCAVAQEAPRPRGGLLARGRATTTTTTQPPQEEAEYVDEEYVEGGAEGGAEAEPEQTPSPAPSSTEGKRLVAGGVRPFRSNADLLDALKRRRAQAAEAKLQAQTQSNGVSPQETSVDHTHTSSSKKRFNSVSRDGNNGEIPAPSKPQRKFKPSGRTHVEETPAEEETSPASVPVRMSRTFKRPSYQ